MTTLATMKDRIASELRRPNITAQIASAISTAIQTWQAERFFGSESRDTTFSTIASQEFYSTGLSGILKIDYVALELPSMRTILTRVAPEQIESTASISGLIGQPTVYAWYGDQMRLYPVPSEVWTVRIGAHTTLAAPASDSETNNFWMTTAEALIRTRAKWELAVHVLRDLELASTMAQVEDREEQRLRKMTTRKTATGVMQSMNF